MLPLRVVFMGSAELSCASLKALMSLAQVVGVVTQPDRPKGRQLKVQPSPVKVAAEAGGFPLLQPERARDLAFLEQLQAWAPDLIVVAAYGQILPRTILALPRFGCINVHTSLLPKYRGAAPIQWAIINGEGQTGVTIMKMDAGLDTGDILTQQSTLIPDEDDAMTLYERLAMMGADLLVQTIPDYISGRIQPRPQPAEGASYAAKITKEDGRVDWSQPALSVWNRVRGLVPWPGAFCYMPGPTAMMIKLWKAKVAEESGRAGEILRADKSGMWIACGSGSVKVLEIQREGGRRLNAEQFLAGYRLAPGQFVLSSPKE